jgi:uncharacterized protein YecA (UPF0149 family)
MSFTNEYHKANALEAALEWMLLRIVSTANDPSSVLADFNQHMLDREKQIQDFGQLSIQEGKQDVFLNALDASVSLAEVRETLVSSITITPSSKVT